MCGIPCLHDQEPAQLSLMVSAAEGGSLQLDKTDIFILTLKLREVMSLAQDHTVPKGQHHSAQAGNGMRRSHCEQKALPTLISTLMSKTSTSEGQAVPW